LIFSQFRRVLELCRTITGEETPVINGDVPLSKRPEITRAFQEAGGFGALVRQIDVGGVGLNLQAASVVILMEPQLKPSTEQQAVARAHRMGQTQPVVVYRLIAADSIDERVVHLSGFKAELFDQLARHNVLATQHPSYLPMCATSTKASCFPGRAANTTCKRRFLSNRNSGNRIPTGPVCLTVSSALSPR
jgi:superfamily II DNA or RNA helicase